jgi:leader peptidase (prepilin peptidase)/N-methyltransferase
VSWLWAVGGTVAGGGSGWLLRGAVFRLSVPAGTPDREVCPHCAAPLRPWPSAWCASCGKTLGIPLLLELSTAAVLALLFAGLRGEPVAVAAGFLGALGVALAAIDLEVQRLPDRLTLPAYPFLLVMLAAAAVSGHDLGALWRALLGGAALAGGYLVLAVLRPGQIGGGDIKLAGLAGLVLGWFGWAAVLIGGALGFVLAALASLGLLAARRVTMRSAISFGPYLLGGALLAVLASGVPGLYPR